MRNATLTMTVALAFVAGRLQAASFHFAEEWLIQLESIPQLSMLSQWIRASTAS